MEADFVEGLDSQKSCEREHKQKILGFDASDHKRLTKRSEVSQTIESKLLYLKIFANVIPEQQIEHEFSELREAMLA